MPNFINDSFIYLIRTLFDLYIFIVMLRVLLQWAGAQFNNPVIQFIVKITNPVIMPLRRIIPPYKGIDLASFFVLLILEFLKLVIIVYLKAGVIPGVIGLLVMAFADILDIILDVFFWAIILYIIISWINPVTHSPIVVILYLLSEPLLRPARRLIPPISGFDISPIPVLIILHLCELLITEPLFKIGLDLAIR